MVYIVFYTLKYYQQIILFEQISLQGVFYWDHHFCTLEAGLEILGPFLLQILFGWQLRAAVGQLTALQKRTSSPSVCPLCDQADETIQHTLVACVFTKQVWTAIFHVLGLLPLAPKLQDSRFCSWWCKIIWMFQKR